MTGPELTGPELTGPELTGPELTGPELTGPELTGPELTGSVVDGLGTGGRVVDLPDHRDAPSRHNTGRGSAPELVDLREGWSPMVYDQAQLPACTSNAVAAAISYVAQAEPALAGGNPSRMYLYWNERYGSGGSGDAGVTLRQALKTLSAYGSAPADLWPYKQQTLRRNPPREAYARARFVGGVSYERVDLGRDDNPDKAVVPLLRCLAARRPVLFGLSVYDNFRHVPPTGSSTRQRRGCGCCSATPASSWGAQRRWPAVVHLPELVGHGLGGQGLLLPVLVLRRRPPPGAGLLVDHAAERLSSGGLSGLAGSVTSRRSWASARCRVGPMAPTGMPVRAEMEAYVGSSLL